MTVLIMRTVMRKCKKCSIEKELNLFRRNGKCIRHTCKECLNAPSRTGKENLGRFKKGIIPETAWKKGNVSPNKGKPMLPHVMKALREGRKNFKATPEQIEQWASKRRIGIGRKSWKAKEWAEKVKERDQWKCQHCGLEDRIKLQAHHIVPWEDSAELRFELSNGMTLCRICHTKEDRRIKPLKAWSLGKKFSEEHRKKLSIARKGKVPWNKKLDNIRG